MGAKGDWNPLRAVTETVAALVFLLLLPASAYPAAQISVSNDKPKQGQTIEVLVKTERRPASNPAQVEFNGVKYRLFPVSERNQAASEPQYVALVPGQGEADRQVPDGERGEVTLAALIGIAADEKPGTYTVRFEDEEKPIFVLPGQFGIQRIRLPRARAELEPAPGEMEAVDRAKGTVSEERLWQGAFKAPLGQRVSAAFGLRRVVNGKLLKDYFHSGIDYAAPEGTAVKAPAAGKVILAATGFRLHGNTLSIDHGQGVVSFYLHLQELSVKTGDRVEPGQVVARVGHTGRASGPHLHFSLYVNRVATNPNEWFKHSF